jgi:ATP-dependent Lhr-like helicase
MEGALHPDVAAWFGRAFPAPTPPQRAAVDAIVRGTHTLVSAPTGSGKSLAAFLPVLSALHHAAARGGLADGIQCLYLSPLRALNTDAARNLVPAVEGVAAAVRARGGTPPPIRVGVRSGDTTQAERRRQAVAPPHVLATTPESLALLLNSPRASFALARVTHVIVDEVHALASTRRGSHLALALERLDRLVAHTGRGPPVRIGLSATVAPLDEVGAFLTGGRPCRLVEAPVKRPLELEVTTPVADLLHATAQEREEGLLDLLHARVQAHASTLVFANTRRVAESLVMGLRARFPEYGAASEMDDARDPAFDEADARDAIAPHHGSMSRETRALVEARLKRGDLRCVVSSASLELGIDVGSVEHVVLVGSPREAARALQRIGRSGHGMGRTRSATLVALDPEDLLECVALAEDVRDGRLDPLPPAPRALDALAQHLVGMTLTEPFERAEALALVRGARPYAALARECFDEVVEALEAEGLVAEDPQGRLVRGRRASLQRYAQNVGTIVGSRSVRVLHGERYVGDVEEAFAESLDADDVFQLAGEAWRFVRATPGTAYVRPAPGEPPTVPRWGAEGLPASARLLARVERIRTANAGGSIAPSDIGVTDSHSLSNVATKANHRHAYRVSDEALSSLAAARSIQAAFAGPAAPGVVPVEGFVDDEGRRVTVLHTALGRGANEALARAVAARRLRSGRAMPRLLVADTGFALLTPRGEPHARDDLAHLRADELRALVLEGLQESERFDRRLAHVAARFLLARDARGPEAARLRRAARALPAVVREAERDVLEDALDIEGAARFLVDLASTRRRLGPLVRLPCASLDAFPIVHQGERAPSRVHAEALRDVVERIEDALALRAQKG